MNVRVTNADKIGLYVFEPLRPDLGIAHHIFVERIARRRVNHENPLSIENNPLRHGELQEIPALLWLKRFPHIRTSHTRQITVARSTVNGYALGDAVVVVAADRVVGVFHRPLDARGGIGAVVDQVSETKANVMRLVDRRKRGEVRVDVRDDEDSQGVASSQVSCQT